jgi:uroporphyrinogen-III decarboxylase
MALEDIQSLLDEIRELVPSPRNLALRELWPETIEPESYGDFGPFRYWYPSPVNRQGRVPYVLEIEPALWHHILHLDVEEFFTKPAVYVENWIRMALYRFRCFQCDVPLSNAIDIDFSSVFVPSLFGVEVIYAADEAPWIAYEPVWTTEMDFARAKLPDFHRSGLSPLAHRFYSDIREIVGGDFRVHFIPWRKGPFSLLTHLRGYRQLLMDLYDRPKFVHEMMAFVTEAMKQWYSERRKFTGEPRFGPIMLGNDEVNTPSISPSMYEEYVLPYETELSDFFGGIDYWHSCGNTTRLAELIARIPNVHMFDVGPWTELSAGVSAYRKVPNCCIMRRINPVQNVVLATDAEMRTPLEEVRVLCEGVVGTMVMYDGLNYVGDWRAGLERIRTLDRMCEDILHRPTEGI